MIEAGMNVARLNFSHGTHAQHEETIALVRRVADSLDAPIALLGDLQGPRIRVGDIEEPRMLEQGQDVVLVHEGEESPGEIPITYDHLADDVHEGDRILIDDGLIELIAMEVRAPKVRARVLNGGLVRAHKGLNLPGVQVSAPSITEKDALDIEFAVAQSLDYLALSFVRRARDIEQLKEMIPKDLLVISKIEKDIALANIESILQASDGVMVARGDLGVELPFEEVPNAQKRIIGLANRMGRPVITATQMLESMVEHPRPTRAEASDVANAILDVNSVRTNYGLPATTFATVADGRTAVLYEKRYSLLFEGPQRADDLREYKMLNATFHAPETTTDPFNAALPIPRGELNARSLTVNPACTP